jgi:hypothetical protein
MSHVALQRALYTALYDDGFVGEMHADPEGVLAPLGLEARERAQLLAVDRRAFRTDPLRRRRSLRVLADEYKASTTLALAETRSLAFAEGFFGSSFFRRAVAEARSFAPAFGEYLLAAAAEGRLRTPQLLDVARLEAARARARRAGPIRPGIGLAPGNEVARVDGATLETIQTVERWLFEVGLMPQVALCDDRPALPALRRSGELAPVCYLVSGGALVEIDDDLHDVLAALAEPRPRAEALRALEPRGLAGARAEALMSSLIEDGLLAEGRGEAS